MRYATLILCLFSMCAANAFASTPFDASGETFQADLYPSQRTAIIRLTQQLAEQIKQTPANVTAIQVDRDDHALREALQHEFPEASLTREAGQLAFSVSSDSGGDSGGHLTVSVKGKDVALSASAKFVEKPWADDWTLYRNANSAKRYVKADSVGPCASEQEAIASARKSAVEQLLPMVRSTMKANAAHSGGETIIVTEQWIRDRLKYSVDSNASKVLVADTFVQRFQRPYGDVWQASILLDASQANIQKLNESYNRTATAQLGRRAGALGAVAGLAVVIGLLYAFINAVTKGYFMWRLRAVAILVAIAGVLIAFAANS